MYTICDHVASRVEYQDRLNLKYSKEQYKEVKETIATSTKLAVTVQPSEIEYIMTSLKGYHIFATDLKNAKQGRECCQMMSYMTTLFIYNKANIHIVTTMESATEQAEKMNKNFPCTAIAVHSNTSQEQVQDLLKVLDNPAGLQFSSVFITQDMLSHPFATAIVTSLQNRDRLARFVIDEANQYTTSNNVDGYNRLIDFLGDKKHIPIMSWSVALDQDQVEDVYQVVGLEHQIIYYRQTMFDAIAIEQYPNCDKLKIEGGLGEVRDVTKWCIMIVETVEKSTRLPLSLNMMNACLLGYTDKNMKVEHKTLPHYGSLNGFEPFTVKKMCQELVNIGILQWKMNPANGLKLRDHWELTINSSSLAAVIAFKQGRIRLLIPSQYIFIFMQQKDKVTREKSDTKDGLCREVLVDQHHTMECSCRKAQDALKGRSSSGSSSGSEKSGKRQKVGN